METVKIEKSLKYSDFILNGYGCLWLFPSHHFPDQNAFYPRLSYGSETTSSINNFQKSTWWVRNMNFLRLKTLQLSYNLPKPWVNKVHLKNAAVYVMGTNLFTLSRFKLWDPELNTDNGASYPNTTSYSVGINFTF